MASGSDCTGVPARAAILSCKILKKQMAPPGPRCQKLEKCVRESWVGAGKSCKIIWGAENRLDFSTPPRGAKTPGAEKTQEPKKADTPQTILGSFTRSRSRAPAGSPDPEKKRLDARNSRSRHTGSETCGEFCGESGEIAGIPGDFQVSRT